MMDIDDSEHRINTGIGNWSRVRSSKSDYALTRGTGFNETQGTVWQPSLITYSTNCLN